MSIAEKFEVIADKVYEKGVADKADDVYKRITIDGTRQNYQYAFAYSDWSGYEFPQPIKPTGVINHMFYACYELTELPQPLDFSEIFTETTDTTVYRRSVFAYCRKLKYIPDLNILAIGGLEEWFVQCWRLHTIELLRVNENTVYNSTFNSCSDLQNITFDGVIGQNIDFKWSPLLTDASINNITEHLKDFTVAGSGSATITFNTAIESKLGESGKSAITAKGWTVEFKTPQ